MSVWLAVKEAANDLFEYFGLKCLPCTTPVNVYEYCTLVNEYEVHVKLEQIGFPLSL